MTVKRVRGATLLKYRHLRKWYWRRTRTSDLSGKHCKSPSEVMTIRLSGNRGIRTVIIVFI